MKIFLIELAINNFISLLKNNKVPKIREFLMRQSTYETMLNVSQYYFSLYNKINNENGNPEPKQGDSTN